MNFWTGDARAIAGNHNDGFRDGGAYRFFRDGKDDNVAAFLAVFFERLRREPFAGFGPLNVLVRDSLPLLPAGIKNGGLETGAAGWVGIALRGDVESATLRAL